MNDIVFYDKQGFLQLNNGNTEYYLRHFCGIQDGFALVQGCDIFMNEKTIADYKKYLKSKIGYTPNWLFRFLQNLFN